MAERPTSIPWSPSSHRHAQLISHGHTPSSFSHDRRLLSPEAAYARAGRGAPSSWVRPAARSPTPRDAQCRERTSGETLNGRFLTFASMLSSSRHSSAQQGCYWCSPLPPLPLLHLCSCSRWFQDGNVRVVGEPSSSRWGDIDVVRVSQGGKHYSCTASTPSRSRADEEVGGHEIGVAVCGGE
ncbi:hypothetical protein B0H14DRAFT_1084700 [Mycena olivaceomarginata]|nr:hypothetical protein B0H14DRAFT_1084700 [Mycena olivaceomarginata]